MAELADALALGASAERRAGSSPVPRTIQRPPKALVIPANSDRTFNLLTGRLPAGLLRASALPMFPVRADLASSDLVSLTDPAEFL
jgi:hypothetical protein